MANIYRKIFTRGSAFSKGLIAQPTSSGKIILTNEPWLDDYRERFESLRGHQAAILESTTYANFAKTQELYIQKELETGQPAYSLAVADWFSVPKILQIDIDCWTGKPGQKVRIKARDKVSVVGVLLIIQDARGTLLEMGEAVQVEPGSAWWCYTTQSAISMTPFPRIQAIAQNLPGNRASFLIH